MNLIDMQHQYCNDHWWLNQPRSDTTLQTFYELLRLKMCPKSAYRQAYRALRFIIKSLND